MKWIKVEDGHPVYDVDVHVVTGRGTRGVARYWETAGKWITQSKHLRVTDTIIKWKYEDAKE